MMASVFFLIHWQEKNIISCSNKCGVSILIYLQLLIFINPANNKRTWISHWENKQHQQIRLCLFGFQWIFWSLNHLLKLQNPQACHLQPNKKSPFWRVPEIIPKLLGLWLRGRSNVSHVSLFAASLGIPGLRAYWRHSWSRAEYAPGGSWTSRNAENPGGWRSESKGSKAACSFNNFIAD